MMGRSLLAFILFLLVIAGAVFLLFDGPREGIDPDDGGGVAAIEQPHQTAPPVSGELPAVEAAGSAARTEIESVASAPITTAEGLPVEAPIPEAEGMRVVVLSKEDQRPLPQARVVFVDSSMVDQSELQRELAVQRAIEPVLETFGRAFATDADGVAIVPFPRGEAFVHARLGDYAGFSEIREMEEAEHRMELERELVARVRVVDARGQPRVGIPTTLRMYEGGRGMDTLGARTEGPDGIAAIRGLDILLRQTDEDLDMRAAIALPLDEPIEASVDLRDLDPEPTTLELSEVGSVLVHVRDPSGAPANGSFQAVLLPAEHDEGDVEDYWSEPLRSIGGVTIEGEGGQVRFALVGVGTEIDVLVRLDDSGATGWARGSGPAHDGDEVELVVETGLGIPVLVGRALDTDGEPLRNAMLQVDLKYAESWRDDTLARTDADGRFRIMLEHFDHRERVTEPVELLREGLGEEPDLSAIVRVNGPLVVGENPVGDVVLTSSPYYLTGTVVDPDHQPIAGAVLAAEQKVLWGNAPDEGYWGPVVARERSLRDGTFSFAGHLDAGNYRLAVRSAGHAMRYMPFHPGDHDVLVQMEAEATLSGSVLLDEEVRNHRISALLSRTSIGLSDEEQPPTQWARLDGEGAFTWEGLSAGTGAVELQMVDTQLLLHRVEGIDILAGEDNADPRIQEIDLRGRLKVLTLTITDGEGSPLRDAQARVLYDAERLHWVNASGQRGVFEIVCIGEEGITVEASADGYRAVRLDRLRADRTVALQPAPRLRAILDPLPSVSQDYVFEAYLQRQENAGDHRFFGAGGPVRFDAAGLAEMPIEGRGPHQLGIVLRRVRGAGQRDNAYLNLDDAALRFDADAVVGVHQIRLGIPQSALDDALQFLVNQDPGGEF